MCHEDTALEGCLRYPKIATKKSINACNCAVNHSDGVYIGMIPYPFCEIRKSGSMIQMETVFQKVKGTRLAFFFHDDLHSYTGAAQLLGITYWVMRRTSIVAGSISSKKGSPEIPL
jgi:hypothetical protein